jgi:hypothetical protein
MNTDKFTHSVYIKAGATAPRNYDATSRTSDDIHDLYTRKAMKSGKTVHDLLSECIAARLRFKLSSE